MDASFVQSSFLGGVWSLSMQGRIDRPDYRTAMAVCLNGLPLDTGAWTRRPGFGYAAHTRGGVQARIAPFNFRQNAPYTLEFTAAKVRAFSGDVLAKTNDAQTVSDISTASPAVVTTTTNHGWATSDQVMFSDLGTVAPLLHNRQFIGTVTDTDKLSLTDALTGDAIDGSTLGWTSGGTISRILELDTPYTLAQAQRLRIIQALDADNKTVAVMCDRAVNPQVLTVTGEPSDMAYAEFEIEPAKLVDGPYLDPITSGALATPGTLNGIVTLTITAAAYDSARAYSIGDFVADGGINYRSRTDANLGNTPASSGSDWEVIAPALAVKADGFSATDIGRHIRMLSEPLDWLVGTTYSTGNRVVYDNVAYQASASTTGNVPPASPDKWAVIPDGRRWTWGKIHGFGSSIEQALAGSVAFGDLTSPATAFDGVLGTTGNNSSHKYTGRVSNHTQLSGYIGKNYSGASAQTIGSVTIYPSSDFGFCSAQTVSGGELAMTITVNLRAKHTAPASGSDGTLLGSIGPIAEPSPPIIITSTDTTTAWEYVWIEIITTHPVGTGFATPDVAIEITVAEIFFFAPAGSSSSGNNTIEVQIFGDPLLYTTAIRSWRLGAYNDASGWPRCGTYHEGRLWLSGFAGNRIDASKSNDIFNFAPTGPLGTVADDNAITYTFNAADVNEIFWMLSDDRGVICGTQAGEWLVSATTANAPLTPTSIQAHRVTAIGCADTEPRRAGLTLTFVQKFKRRLMEYFADVYSGRFSSPNLTLTAKHLTEPGIAEIAYQQELAPVVWQRLEDGTLIGVTYKRESLSSSQGPTFAGHHRHELGSDRTIVSLCVGPSADGALDALAIVTADADGLHHVEFLSKQFEESGELTDARFLDDAVAPSAYEIDGSDLILYGLWHLNGQTVAVWAGGLDCGDFAVADGSVTVPLLTPSALTSDYVNSFDDAMPIVVGFTYTSDGQIVRPATREESGARNGPGFGKKRRNQSFSALLVNAKGLSFGTDFAKLNRAQFRHPGGTDYAALELYSGFHWDTVNDDYSYDGALCWRVTRPYPATIAAISSYLQTMDK